MKEPKVKSEAETRRTLLTTAKRLGCGYEVQRIFDRTDRLLRNCGNETEREHIRVLALVELHRLLGCTGGLEVNGMEIIPADPLSTPESD